MPDLTDAASPRDHTPWGTILRNVALVLVLLAMLWLAFNVRLPELDTLQAEIAELGAWGVLAFVALYAVVALTPIPVTIMAVTGGLVFGAPLGTVLSLVGVVIGCYGAYWLARALGRDTVLRMLGGHSQMVQERLEGGGFFAVCTLRLMPGVPYWPVNYGSGALGISGRDFLIATAVSSLPGQLSLVAIGAFIAEPSLLNGIVVGVSWVVVIVLTIFAFRRWRASSRPLSREPRQP